MKKMLKKTFILLIAITIIVTNTTLAVSQKDSTDLQNKINEAKDDLKDVNNNKSEAEKKPDHNVRFFHVFPPWIFSV